MAEENGHAARPTPSQYPDPQPYPSPQMRPTYAWPPAQGQSNEAYRQSPGQSNASLPPMNLPPLRSIDPQSQSQPPSHPPSHQNEGAAQQQGGQPMPGYHPPPPPPLGVQHHNHTSAPQLMRYAPIPQSDAHMMAGSRHKKEIKRRTKTGCLTCRKRRIKVSQCRFPRETGDTLYTSGGCSRREARNFNVQTSWNLTSLTPQTHLSIFCKTLCLLTVILIAVRRAASRLSELPEEQTRVSRLRSHI